MEDLIEADQQTSERPNNFLVVPARAKSSAELEAREAAMLAFDKTLDGRLPVPFFEDGELEPLGEIARNQLIALDITVDEYTSLMMEK